jgi:hypothetical protein
MRKVNPQSRYLLPRRVLAALVGVTIVVVVVAFAASSYYNWAPPRAYAGVILPIYFAVFLAVLTLSFVISGNTLMHHYRTGTVQRATDPVWFWRIVTVQSVMAGLLLFFGFVSWSNLNG